MEALLKGLISVVAIVLVFGLAVFVHEFGHMFFAIIRRVPVESFAIGMGPKICAWHWRGIEFSLRWFPVGGFVKLGGSGAREGVSEGKPAATTPEEPARALKREGEPACGSGQDEEDKTLTESAYDDLLALSDKGLLTRLLVFGGGVFMNYVTAIVAVAILMMLPDKFPAAPLNVYRVAEASAAAQAGLLASDRIIAVDGRPVQYDYELSDIAQEKAQQAKGTDGEALPMTSVTLTLTVARTGPDGNTQEITLPEIPYRACVNDVELAYPPMIGKVRVGTPADKADLKPGDRVLAINGEPITTWNEFTSSIRANPGVELSLLVQRGDKQVETTVTPTTDPTDENRSGLIGVERGSAHTVRLPGAPVMASIIRAPGETWGWLKRLVVMHVDFFKQASFKDVRDGLGGPVLIARMTAREALNGLPDVMGFFITLNLLLLIFNLLPLPVLDGGFIVISIVEAIIRRPIPPRILGPVYTFFVIFFISLMVLITFWDIKRWVS